MKLKPKSRHKTMERMTCNHESQATWISIDANSIGNCIKKIEPFYIYPFFFVSLAKWSSFYEQLPELV